MPRSSSRRGFGGCAAASSSSIGAYGVHYRAGPTQTPTHSSEALQLQRLLARNGGSTDAARQKIGAQRPLGSKLVFADHVVDNSGSLNELESQVDRVVRRLRRDAGVLWVFSWLIPPFGILSGIITVMWRLFVKQVGSAPRRKRKTYQPDAARDTIELAAVKP
jgi:dephospho-CoA kinase